jgi:hypothetical protein
VGFSGIPDRNLSGINKALLFQRGLAQTLCSLLQRGECAESPLAKSVAGGADDGLRRIIARAVLIRFATSARCSGTLASECGHSSVSARSNVSTKGPSFARPMV